MDQAVGRLPELIKPPLESPEVSSRMAILGSLAASYAKLEDLEVETGRVLDRIKKDLDALNALTENP